MQRPSFSGHSRGSMRPLIWLALTALATSTSPLGAQSKTERPSNAASTAAPSVPPITTPKDDGAGLRTAGYIVGGIGFAGFLLFAIAGIGAKNAHDRLDEACAAGRCNDASH